MDKEQASKAIADNLDKISALLNECTKISDESGVGFELPYGGEGTLMKGMGAYYSPEGDTDAEWRRNEYLEAYSGWHSSAGTC